MIAPIFTNGKDSSVPPVTNPKAMEKSMLMNRHSENVALFRDESPIEIEYIEAVIAKVASVGEPLFSMFQV